jgi:ATP-binding cassette subfamily B protein
MKRPRKLLQRFLQSLPGLWRVLRYLGPSLRKQRLLIATSMFALLAEAVFRALEPWPLKWIFDHLLRGKGHTGPPGSPAPGGLGPTTLITLAALAIILIRGLRALASYGNRVGFARISNRVIAEVRDKLYRHLQRLSLSFHTRARSGDLTLRVLSDVNTLKDAAVTALLPLLVNAVVLAGMVGMLFWMHWKLALVALSVLPLLGLRTARLSRRIHERAREQKQREAGMAATAAEAIAAIKVLQALGLEGVFADHFSRRNEESRRGDAKGARLSAALERTVGLLLATATALVLWYGALLVLSGELTPGALLVVMAYLRNTFRPVEDFAKHTERLAKASAAGERVLDVLGQTPEVRDLPGAQPAPPFRGAVLFEDVTFAYEPGRPVLERITFEVPAGGWVALVGPSGIGKSTLLALLLRLYDPTRGCVRIDGHDIREYTLASLRPQFSVVLQDTVLFAASVRENIAYGAPGVTPEAVETAARLANAHEFIQSMPQGYDTPLGERGATLSGGQRQRIAIARAAIRQAPILLLDEPATGLDGENERLVLDALERLAEGHTTVLVTHDLRLAARAGRILYLESGRVLEGGTHEELMQAGGRYATLYGLQVAAADGAPGGRACGPPPNGEDRSNDGAKPCHFG